jgi:CBS domain-containing protein
MNLIMKLKDIITKDPQVISPGATICEAGRIMKECDVGMLPVCDGERLVGAITDRDLAIRAIAEGHDPLKTKVRDVMTPGICWCFEDQSLEEVAALMEEKKIRRIAVVDRNKRLVGIASLGDFAVRSQNERLTEEILECVSEPCLAKNWNAVADSERL